MEITYQLRESDISAVTEDVASRSPTMRRQLRRTLVAFLFSFCALSFLFWIVTDDIALASMMLFLAVLAVLLMPAMTKRVRRRLVTAMVREGKNRALYLPTTLRIDRDSLTWTSESGSGHVKFAYLERVQQTPTHLLIYLSSRNAYVVPRDGVISGDFDGFAWDVERRWKSAMDAVAEPHEWHATLHST
jgi:hypothetical protein